MDVVHSSNINLLNASQSFQQEAIALASYREERVQLVFSALLEPLLLKPVFQMFLCPVS